MYRKSWRRRCSLWRVAPQWDYYACGFGVYLRRLPEYVYPQPCKDEKAFGLSFTDENYLWITLLLPLPSPSSSHFISWSVRRAAKLPQRTAGRWFGGGDSRSLAVVLRPNLHKRLSLIPRKARKTQYVWLQGGKCKGPRFYLHQTHVQ